MFLDCVALSVLGSLLAEADAKGPPSVARGARTIFGAAGSETLERLLRGGFTGEAGPRGIL